MLAAENILKRLNEEQKEAVINYEGPSFIVAGPGSGNVYIFLIK